MDIDELVEPERDECSNEIFELKEDGNYWHWSLRYQ